MKPSHGEFIILIKKLRLILGAKKLILGIYPRAGLNLQQVATWSIFADKIFLYPHFDCIYDMQKKKPIERFFTDQIFGEPKLATINDTIGLILWIFTQICSKSIIFNLQKNFELVLQAGRATRFQLFFQQKPDISTRKPEEVFATTNFIEDTVPQKSVFIVTMFKVEWQQNNKYC